MARPTKYKAEYAEQAYKLCLLGAIDRELANFFEVDEVTINRWKESHPEFCKSLKKGKVQADARVVEKLLQRAYGYEYQEKTYERIENMVVTPEGDVNVVPGTKIKTAIKQMAPDVTAQIFWLKNRQPSKWRDKQEIEHGGKMEHTHKPDLSKLTDEELKSLERIIGKSTDA